MQAKQTGFSGYKARTATNTASTNNAQGAAQQGTEGKKGTGEVLFRVKRKDAETGKWVTLGSLYKNTKDGDVFYSLSVKEAIEPGLHRVYDNTPPENAKQ